MRRALAVVIGGLVLAGAALTANYLRPVPAVHASSVLPAEHAVGGSAPALPWPSIGGAAVAATGPGRIAAVNADAQYPIASVAKIMTALVVLEDHPLPLGQQGPAVTISDPDVADYQNKQQQGESVVPVQTGEALTEYQLLEGLLIPSGNNIADLLASWDAGSVSAFVVRMNSRAKALGMNRTHYDDTSGFSPATVSTASDLLLLAPVAMAIPTFAEIVAKPQTQLPVAGTVYNVDYTLGRDGIVGIKTGSSPQAGACFVFAADYSVDGHPVVIYGDVIYQHTLDSAFAATRSLVEAVRSGLRVERIVAAGQRIGTYRVPWGSDVAAVAVQTIDVVAWPGTAIRVAAPLNDLKAPVPAGASSGYVQAGTGPLSQQTKVVTSAAIPSPGRRWRLLRLDFLSG